MGAQPYAFSLPLIIQEGFEIEKIEKILDDVKFWLSKLDANLITSDTKVVEANVDMIINTSGIGIRNEHLAKNLEVVREFRGYPYSWIRDCGLKEGDVIIVSGNIAEHGVAIMLERGFELDVKSDVYPVWLFLKNILDVGITTMKDPTRGLSTQRSG